MGVKQSVPSDIDTPHNLYIKNNRLCDLVVIHFDFSDLPKTTKYKIDKGKTCCICINKGKSNKIHVYQEPIKDNEPIFKIRDCSSFKDLTTIEIN